MRHLPPSDGWHPATDSLAGTDQYGNARLNGAAAWSVSFGTFDEFLFATGDAQKWLMATKASVIGETYADSPRTIMRSSIRNVEYQAKWYNRGDYTEDPWVSLTDHADAITNGDLLYGENGFNQASHTWTIRSNGGMNVFVRSATGVERE